MSVLSIMKVAVIIPCYNEAIAISRVVKSFIKILPRAEIHVFDNNSSDNTAKIARESGAIVHRVKLQGKGNVVRRMFADIDADIYVMVDGDMTYDPKSAPIMIDKLVKEELDMVVGCRHEDSSNNENYRPGHRLGNKLFTGSIQKMFGGHFTDMLSGYRVFSRRFVKSFAAESNGFEIETELTVHTLKMKLPYDEVKTQYAERPIGSNSKLSTYKDGLKILWMIIKLYYNEKPRHFWGIIGVMLFIISITLIAPIIVEFNITHEVPRFPTLILAIALAISGFLSFTIGIVLGSIAKQRCEAKHLKYLSIPLVKNDK